MTQGLTSHFILPKNSGSLKSPTFTSGLLGAMAAAIVLYNSGSSEIFAESNTDHTARGTRILDSLEIDLGDRSIFYNRIEPPILKPWVKQEAAPSEASVVYVPTAEEVAEEQRFASLRYEGVVVHAAVYVGRGSELRMWTELGEVVALSSVDFRLFEMLFDFEGEGVSYSTFCMQYSWTREELAEWRREDPTATWPVEYRAFPAELGGMSRFEVISAPRGQAGEAAIEALEALHAYHDANRKALVAAFAEREKARLAYEQEVADRKANPPPPQDTVITYFPIRSVYAPKGVNIEVADQ